MLINYQGRGILIPVYFIVSITIIVILSQVLRIYIGGVFATEYDVQIILGIGTFVSGLWTYYTSDDFINVNGKKEKIYLNNTFLFLSIKIWSYIMIFGGILVLISGILETMDRLNIV